MTRTKVFFVIVLAIVALIATTGQAAAFGPDELRKISNAVGEITSDPAIAGFGQRAEQALGWAENTYGSMPTNNQTTSAVQNWRWGQAAVPYINKAANALGGQ